MEKNFDAIFSQIQKSLENQLAENSVSEATVEQAVNGGGTIPFELRLDGNGNGHYEISKRGWGVTISATATILEPSGAMFNLVVHSSDGGGGEWYNVSTGQSVSCKLKTSFWHSTKITVDVHCNKPNTTLKARLDYNY